MPNIQCEINKIFPPKGGKFGMSLKPLEDNEDIKASNSYKEQYNNFTCNLFIDNDEMPDWAKEGNQISFSYYVNKGWVNIDNDKTVKVINGVVEDIKEAFPNAKVETIKVDGDKNTDFNYGANEKKNDIDDGVKRPDDDERLDSDNYGISMKEDMSPEKYNFAEYYLYEYEQIGKIVKPDFDLRKLDERNFKDIITSCKISMTNKFGK